MRRRKGRVYPETNFSSETHGGQLGYARFNARRDAIRASSPHPTILRALGMESSDKVDVESLPAVQFSKLYRSPYPMEADRDEEEHETPVPLFFDHTRSIPVQPDHMLSSLASNVMTMCLHSLQNDDERTRV